MKRVLTYSVFVVGLLMPVVAHSQDTEQPIRYGLVGGVALSDIQSEFEQFDDASSDQVGFTAGIQAAWRFIDVMSLKPELVFARRGWETQGSAFGQQIEANYNISYLELPLLLNASGEVAKGIHPKLMAGPHASLFLDGSQDRGSDPFTGADDDIDGEQVNDFQFGFTGAIGADFDIGRITLTSDVRYQRNVTGIFEEGVEGEGGSVEHESWQLTVGFLY